MKPDLSTRRRSVLKALSWETFSNLVCFGLAYAMFGNIGGCAVFTARVLPCEADPLLLPRADLAPDSVRQKDERGDMGPARTRMQFSGSRLS